MVAVQDFRDAVRTQGHLRLCKRRLDGILSLEDLGQFFEGAAARLYVEEVDESEFEDVPENEQEIVLACASVTAILSALW